MSKAAIISIGNELLSGRVDTNTAWLADKLFQISIPVVTSFTVGDDLELIAKALTRASEDADIIFITGGLGPTADDVTRQAVAKFLNVELELNQKALEKLESFFRIRNIDMPKANRIQAYLPAGAEELENKLGTAPGILARSDGRMIVVMPGVPSEMKGMFQPVYKELAAKAKGPKMAGKKLRCYGSGESKIAEMLGSLMDRDRNPQINITVSFVIITLYLIATAEDHEKAAEMICADEKLIRDRLGDLVYGEGDEQLSEVVGRLLMEKGKTVTFAESCTGGLISKLITDIPGSSVYFLQSWVTYSNKSKTEELGVDPSLIEKYGAVSEEVACAMASGARERAGADIAVSVTGIAGPGGGTDDKPVGLVFIGLDDGRSCRAEKFIFSHDREFVRLRTAQTVLNMLRLKLLN